MMATVLNPGPALTLDGEPLESETNYRALGPTVLVLTTVIPGCLGISVRTTYVGHQDTGTVVVEQLEARGVPASTEAHALAGDAVPVVHSQRRCLYDHLARVQAFC